MSVFQMDKKLFKKKYEKHKGNALNGAEKSAINELYNQYKKADSRTSNLFSFLKQIIVSFFKGLNRSQSDITKETDQKSILMDNKKVDLKHIAESLMNESKFKSVSGFSASEIPDAPGLYAIRIKDINKLPSVFSEELNKRGHNLLYIGIASKSLRERLWKEELNHQKPATFFRSLGAMLGFRPVKGSLSGKKNKRNYKFDEEDTEKIRDWIKEHLLVNYYVVSDNLEDVEKQLIYDFKPIVNIENNPNKMPIISDLRHECVEIAKSN